MSEYQYYEFRAIDRPLTEPEMGKLRSLSTRAEITPASFVNTYNWGDFKGNPDRLIDLYFDAFIYVANWGTRRLTLRLPQRLLDIGAVAEYCCKQSVHARKTDEFVVVDFWSEDESPEWEEGDGRMASLVSSRAD